MQSKVASLWQMQETMKKIAPTDPENGGDIPQQSSANLEPAQEEESSLADTLEEQMPELFAAPGLPTEIETAPAESRAPITAEFEDSVLSDLEIPLNPSAEREEEEEEEEERDSGSGINRPRKTGTYYRLEFCRKCP